MLQRIRCLPPPSGDPTRRPPHPPHPPLLLSSSLSLLCHFTVRLCTSHSPYPPSSATPRPLVPVQVPVSRPLCLSLTPFLCLIRRNDRPPTPFFPLPRRDFLTSAVTTPSAQSYDVSTLAVCSRALPTPYAVILRLSRPISTLFFWVSCALAGHSSSLRTGHRCCSTPQRTSTAKQTYSAARLSPSLPWSP
jgi:hypothetical protein